jgi:hypothetical protein
MLPTILRKPRTADDIALGAQLAKMQGRPIGPAEVARVLKDAGVKYVIVGAHAANGYTGRPRATVDVDVIVQNPKKAAKAIAAAFPHLQMQDTLVVTRFKDQELEAIDLMKATASKLWARLLKDALEMRLENATVRVPSVEGVLAAKFAAMMSPHRRSEDKMIDGGDFIRIVKANPHINLALVEELAELLFPDAGKFVLKLVDDARAGRQLKF